VHESTPNTNQQNKSSKSHKKGEEDKSNTTENEKLKSKSPQNYEEQKENENNNILQSPEVVPQTQTSKKEQPRSWTNLALVSGVGVVGVLMSYAWSK
jgi:hypothetical protein